MDKIILESSSDEDDSYTNSAARLRGITNKELNSKDIDVEDIYNEKISYTIQTRSRTQSTMVRGKRNAPVATKVNTRRSRRRNLRNNSEFDVEFVMEEKLESYKNDIISLLDDDCNEDDNYEINIKVYWRSNRIDRLSMRRHESFIKIFQHYADLEKVSINEVLIMKKDKVVNHTDTPASLKLSIIDILDGGIVNPGMNTLSTNETKDEETCSIKVQTANKKQTFTIRLKEDEQFKTLFVTCSKELGVNESSLKLCFDGEQIDPTDTPKSLDLEGEACVDLYILA
ncbi:DNA repair protein Rad60 isoform X3 [Cardiocondyla obscurior]|uniref:DNA repair protein Rad60 isoform X3 n=1 Tax=Cardiocondyla obscurior TaxID=286306 RepID=UPI0039657D05